MPSVLEGSSRFKTDVEGSVREGSRTCASTQTYIVGPDSFENVFLASGCTDTFNFTVAADLSTAHVTATVPLTELVCDEISCEPVGDPIDVVVDVTWTAFEPAHAVRERGVFHYLDSFTGLWCKNSFSRSGLAAFGTATGSMDGTDLGTAQFAELFSGRMSFADSCR